MNWLRKVEKRRTPPGAEVRILKALPRITVVGTLLALSYPILARLLLDSADTNTAKQIRSADIFAIATEISLITAVVTIAIGCVIVYIMKGPAYGADSMPVQHADKPKKDEAERE
jgi:hypothetical protein